MFYYAANFILWMVDCITSSTIYCFAFDAKNEDKERWKLIAGLVAVRLPFTVSKFLGNSNTIIRTVSILAVLVGMIIYAHFMFKGYLWQKISFVVFEVVLGFLAEMGVQIMLNDRLTQYDTMGFDIPLMLEMSVYVYLFTTIIYIMLLFIWRKVLGHGYDSKVFLLFCMFPISQILLVASINEKIYSGITASGIIVILGFVIGIISDILLLYLLLKQQNMQEMKMRIAQMQMAWDAEHTHYEEIESRRNELAKLRHDLNDHFIVIKDLLNSAEYEKANEMLDTLIDYVISTREYVYCADPIVNAVLNENEVLCKERGISFKYEISISTPLEMNAVAICSIFSNLLKNAVAGATEALKAQKEAYVTVKAYADAAYLHVIVQNSYAAKEVIKQRRSYGQEILRSLAERYDGQMEIKKDNDVYEVSISVKAEE